MRASDFIKLNCKAAMALCLVALFPATSRATVRPHPLFSDGAVVQQGMEVPVWGWADEGEKVTVRFQGQTATTVARNGSWMLRLKPLKPGGPFCMSIAGTNTVELKNILVGEVWLCSGQSNMVWQVKHCNNPEAAIAQSADTMLRLFTVPYRAWDVPAKDVPASWSECVPETVADFSGVAYFFGRDLRRSLKVPVGLINASVGMTTIHCWMRRSFLFADPYLRSVPSRPPNKVEEKPWMRPSVFFNGMIAPLQPYAIRGVAWYQGESNTWQAYDYRKLFPALIRNWREDWGQGDFPFLFVQIAPFYRIIKDRSEKVELPTAPEESDWAELREAQLITGKTVPNTAMVVITDYGDDHDTHPRDKEPVGTRLALAARAIVYGDDVVYQGPTYESMRIEGDRVILSFNGSGDYLVARGGELRGFTIAGEDRRFFNGQAEIRGSEIAVWSPQVRKPVAVRFGWAQYPVVNLFNSEGLPASPFRTDDFPMKSAPK